MNLSDFSHFIWISPAAYYYLYLMTASLIFDNRYIRNSKKQAKNVLIEFENAWDPTIDN